jgi:hypothetical protein
VGAQRADQRLEPAGDLHAVEHRQARQHRPHSGVAGAARGGAGRARGRPR